jgi:hypothetical protein
MGLVSNKRCQPYALPIKSAELGTCLHTLNQRQLLPPSDTDLPCRLPRSRFRFPRPISDVDPQLVQNATSFHTEDKTFRDGGLVGLAPFHRLDVGSCRIRNSCDSDDLEV